MRIFRIPFPWNTSGGLLLKLCFFSEIGSTIKTVASGKQLLKQKFLRKNLQKKKKEKEREPHGFLEAHSEPSPLFSPKILPYNAFLGYKLQNS